MNNKSYYMDYIILWSSLLTVLSISHKANGLVTATNDWSCSHIQCSTKCPEDSHLKLSLENEEDDFDDYEDEFLGHHEPYIEEIGNFEEVPSELEPHDDSLPQHLLKERQRREVFFQEDIDRCCNDQKCVCNECPDIPKCAEGYVAVEVVKGHNVPGNCCSTFRCNKKEQCQLGVKQSWWITKCRNCSCFGEEELCDQNCSEEEVLPSCYSEYWNKPMLNGAFWKEGSCTNCTCELGERRCFTPVCVKLDCPEVIKIEDECCPKCLHDLTDDNSEIELNKEEEEDIEEDIAEEYPTESTPIDSPKVNENKESNINLNHDHSNIPVDDEYLSNKAKAAEAKSKELLTSTSFGPSMIHDISSTLEPKPVEDSSILESSTSVSSSSSMTLPPILKIFSSAVTSTEAALTTMYSNTSEESQTFKEMDQDSSTASANTEVAKPKTELQSDFSSTTRTTMDLPKSSSAATGNSEELSTIDRIMVTEKTAINGEQDESKLTSTEEYIKETTTETGVPLTISTYRTTEESFTPNFTESVFETHNTLSTENPIDIATEALDIVSNSPAPNTHLISTSTPARTTTLTTTNADLDLTTTTSMTIASTTAKDLISSQANSTEHPYSVATSTDHLTTSTTSTTSSPYSAFDQPTATLDVEETISTSSTSAPEPLRPLFQSYGDMTSEEGAQNKMRIVLDEVDYVVIIGIFIGSVLCISLGLIIRYTKNRKNMYSSVPNSETNLSQNSTNTVLTIPSCRDNRCSNSN